MNITELDSYNLDDAVKFNDQLNPRLWDDREHLRPEVRERLLQIAEDFKEFLGVTDLAIRDITVSGSNAAYTYTPNSDIDLHLVVDMPDDEIYRELFDAKKFQYNEQHNITIGGYDVELYVQDADAPHISQGIYSVLNNEWLQVPRRRRAEVDDISTRSKYEKVGTQIERAIKSGNLKRITRLAEKIKKMRQTGLEAHGEFGPENLAFKMLRSQGLIKQLYDARNAAKDQELSLKERKKPGSVFTYGFKHEESTEPEVLEEEPVVQLSDEEILQDFIDFCFKELKLESMPVVKLRKDPQWSVRNKTFGRYIDDHNLLEVAWGQRHIMDILRTVAHELTHRHQHEREDVPSDAGETGSRYENEANARAGILMRDYARLHPEYFAVGQAEELHGDEVDESVRGSAVAALSACIIGGGTLSGCATQQGMRPMDAARIIYNARQYNSNVIRADVAQELNNFIRAQSGDPNAQNQSGLYQIQRRTQNESASGYIPTKKQAKDPRYSMALTVDIKPGQVGKEANKLKLKTDSQGHPQIANPNGLFEQLMLEFQLAKEGIHAPVSKNKDSEQYYKFILAKYKMGRPLTRQEQEFVRTYRMMSQQVAEKKLFALAENEQLDEVKMSPSALQKWAKSPEAEGIRAGFEAELIFRDTASGDDDDYEMEPDYDMDERCRSIQQVIDFFQNGEYGGMSPRQERALQEGLDEQYFEWQDEQMYASWRDERDDLIREAWLKEKPMEERIHAALVDGLELTDAQADAVVALHEKRARKEITGQEMSEEQLEMASQYSEAAGIADDVLDEDVEQTIEKEDGFYDEVLQDFRDGFYVDDDSGFFDDVGLRWMSDVASNYDLDWPYMTGGGGNDGSRSWEEIGDSLNSAIDMPVKVSSNYHSTARRPGIWIVEPDSSLQPDDREDFGLEIVSPPLPLEQALEKLQQVTEWANSSEGNAYTNDSTGLHMGVSVPYKGGDVDYLKLILFLGDEYVLQSFGREANTYTKSAMKSFRENLKSGRADPAGAMKLMQHGLLELAQKEIQKGVGQGKYTSAHIQDGYIEFRSAGGDWLAEENADPNKLTSTMLRYARAMQIAADPATDRREYAKKLYKLIAPEGDSQLALFSQFAAGELNKEQLKKRWAEKTLGNEKKINQYFKLYQKVNGVWTAVPGAEYRGMQEPEVKNRVWSKYGREALDSGEYQLVNMSDNQEWEVYDVNTGKTLEIVQGANKGAAADKVFDKYHEQGIGFNVRPWVDPATLTPRAKLAKRIVDPKQQKSKQATNERGVPYWEVYEKETGHVVHTFLSDTAVDAKADGKNWLASVGAEQPDLFDVRPKIASGSTGIPEVPMDVAQNFDQPQDATEVQRNWNIVNRQTGQVVDTVSGASLSQAEAVLNDVARRQSISPDDLSLRSTGLTENFADGKGPGRPGDSQRYGIPKGATIAQLEKASHAKGRKGQLARWQLNMRRGKAKAK
jgi:Putative amidoligase enzyme